MTKIMFLWEKICIIFFPCFEIKFNKHYLQWTLASLGLDFWIIRRAFIYKSHFWFFCMHSELWLVFIAHQLEALCEYFLRKFLKVLVYCWSCLFSIFLKNRIFQLCAGSQSWAHSFSCLRFLLHFANFHWA